MTGASVLKHDPTAWEEGFKAGESAARIPARCPYPAGTTVAWSWHSGYVEGDAKRQGYSYSRGALSKDRHQVVSSPNREASVIYASRNQERSLRSALLLHTPLLRCG